MLKVPTKSSSGLVEEACGRKNKRSYDAVKSNGAIDLEACGTNILSDAFPV